MCIWLTSWSWLLLIFPLLFIPLLFPTGRPLSSRWNWVLALGLGMCLVLLTVATSTSNLTTTAVPWSVRNPIGFTPDNWGQYVLPLWSLGLVTLTLLSLASVVLRYRRGGPVERRQIKWLLSGCVVFAAVYAPWILVGTQQRETLLGQEGSLVFTLSLLAIPATIAIAILRQRLWDIDVIIRRTLIYSVLSLVLGLLYFGSVLLLQPVLGGLMGPGTALADAYPSIFLGPLRGSLGRGYNRLTHALTHRLLWSMMGGPLTNPLCKRLGLKPWSTFSAVMAQARRRGVPMLYGFSTHVLPGRTIGRKRSTSPATVFWTHPRPGSRRPTCCASSMRGCCPSTWALAAWATLRRPE